jgi:hypothetical protein
LYKGSFKYSPAITCIKKESRHTLGMILDDQLSRIAAGDLNAIRLDGIDVLRQKDMAYKKQQKN